VQTSLPGCRAERKHPSESGETHDDRESRTLHENPGQLIRFASDLAKLIALYRMGRWKLLNLILNFRGVELNCNMTLLQTVHIEPLLRVFRVVEVRSRLLA
jgi:hypothetical protein